MSEPLAERLRPRTLDDYIGQKHLVGEGAVLRKMIDAGRISSFILWGPPGVGKTTLAQIIANKLQTPFYTLSAVTSGVKDVRDVIERAQKGRFFDEPSPILFIDEIHRFSKSQQDSLLGAVEKGIVTLIGATTENPSFEVIRPLLSRCQLYVLKSLEKEELLKLVGLGSTGNKKVKQFSLGMKQRLGIACALASDPEVLVLDEPMNGVDPEGIVELRNILLSLNKDKNITLILSSHILSELELLSTDFVFVKETQNRSYCV